MDGNLYDIECLYLQFGFSLVGFADEELNRYYALFIYVSYAKDRLSLFIVGKERGRDIRADIAAYFSGPSRKEHDAIVKLLAVASFLGTTNPHGCRVVEHGLGENKRAMPFREMNQRQKQQ